LMKVSKLNGTKVITANAYVLGEVDGAHVDIDTWKVTHLDVDLTNEATKELGFKKPFLGSMKVCLPVTIVKEFGDVITLENSLQELKSLKECKS
jgi:sporulation protein YlmC with PRC-barrel domain